MAQVALAADSHCVSLTTLTVTIPEGPTVEVAVPDDVAEKIRAGEPTMQNTQVYGRIDYADWQRTIVTLLYLPCNSRAKKLWLCDITCIPDIRRLYQLASDLGVTRKSKDLSDREAARYAAGDTTVMSNRNSKKVTPEEEIEILARREDPDTMTFSAIEDETICATFRKQEITEIAKALGRSETAIMYRARQLSRADKRSDGSFAPARPLRSAAIGFPIGRVAAWLGMDEDGVKALRSAGAVIRPIRDTTERIVDYWVFARSLAPFLEKYQEMLVKEMNADRVFIREILETAPLLEDADEITIAKPKYQPDELPHERCLYVDHGHVCHNPWAGASCGVFCKHGADTECDARNMRW